MTQRDDLLGRLKELHTGTKAHRATSRVIRAMIFDGDYAGATTALDTLEDALHPALAAGGGGASVFHGAAVQGLDLGTDLSVPDDGNHYLIPFGVDGVALADTDGYWDPTEHCFLIPVGQAGTYLTLMQVDWTASDFDIAHYAYVWIDITDKDRSTPGGWFAPPDRQEYPVFGAHTIQQLSWVSPLDEGDTVAGFAYQTSYNINHTGVAQNGQNFMSLTKLFA